MSLPENMIVCPKCNHKIPENSVFCPVCRTQLSSATVSIPSYEKLKQMFSQVDKWEFTDFRPVVNRCAPKMTAQQKQEELEKRIQNARDIAIQNRIAVSEVANRRQKLIRIIILSIIATALTILFFAAVIAGVNHGGSQNTSTQEMNILYSNVDADIVSI